MAADDEAILGPEVYEGKHPSRKCPTDGFIRFNEVTRLENQGISRAVLLDEFKKNIVIGFFHDEELELGDTVHVRIFQENDCGDKYLVYYHSPSQRYGFISGGTVWVSKDMIAVMTDRTLRGVIGSRVAILKCKCGSELVLAVSQGRTLAVCSACKRIDHIV